MSDWTLTNLSVQFVQKRADVSLNRGTEYVNVSFSFDPKGDQRESEVQRRAIARAKELLRDAASAEIQPAD